MKHGWRTGAIIPELEHEISCSNSKQYKRSLQWMLALEKLIQKYQVLFGGLSIQKCTD